MKELEEEMRQDWQGALGSCQRSLEADICIKLYEGFYKKSHPGQLIRLELVLLLFFQCGYAFPLDYRLSLCHRGCNHKLDTGQNRWHGNKQV